MKILNLKISIFLIWLFHISGALGLIYYDIIFFAAITPINLFLTSLLLMINQKNPGKRELIGVSLIFFTGILVEYLGVNFNLIFGEYEYGKNLGPKVLGVPFMIGLNWIILTLIAGGLSSKFIKRSKFLFIIVGSLLMLFLDLLIEPIAPVLDFWEFNNSVVPLSNYRGWFITGLVTQTIYYYAFRKKEFVFSLNLYCAIFVFFLLLNLLGNY